MNTRKNRIPEKIVIRGAGVRSSNNIHFTHNFIDVSLNLWYNRAVPGSILTSRKRIVISKFYITHCTFRNNMLTRLALDSEGGILMKKRLPARALTKSRMPR